MNRLLLRAFFAFYAITFPVQLAGGYFTQLSVKTWYVTLEKSALTPPGAAFGIAWTILYILMAFAAARVFVTLGTWKSRALRWWLIQLLLGLYWCIVFFGQREIAFGVDMIIANWVAVALTTYLFARVERTAGLLMLPLLAWLSFASYLNIFVMLHN